MSFDNVRRMAERGLMRANQPPRQSAYVDMFQHILDEHEREDKEIRNTVIDEAVKVVESKTVGYSTVGYARSDIADKLKELKE